ncbi:hypothetical protein [Deinococcus navajonensis]|uniref:Uncharacterized protein n=1 Tax=Deinococcus navajonensis TaxID=309884 RepID=A0ABV8XR46_9DEIO
MALTFPQLNMHLKGRGQILYPRLKPQLDAAFANLSSKPGPKGEPSDTAKLIKDHEDREAALARGELPQFSAEQLERQKAYRIMFGPYLSAQRTQADQRPAQPVVGLPPETARAIIAFADAGLFPPDIWPDVSSQWRQIQATAVLPDPTAL